MYSAEIGIFEKANKVRLGCLLEGQNCLTLESEVALVLLGDFSHESLEGKLSNQKFGLKAGKLGTERNYEVRNSRW